MVVPVRWLGVALALPPALALHVALLATLLGPSPTSLLEAGGAPLEILDRRGAVLATFATTPGQSSKTAWLGAEALPPLALALVIDSEDEHFWRHGGIDGVGIARAAWLDLKGGHIGYGASTLTMQVARMLISPGEARTWRNKMAEAALALRLERTLDKRAILEHWFNRAYFGNGAVGLGAAARLYFGVDAAMLSPAQAALLAVLPRAPSRYDPLTNLAAAQARRDALIERLLAEHRLDPSEAAAAKQPVVATRHGGEDQQAPHFVAWILEHAPPALRARGGTIKTTLDLALQRQLEFALAARMADAEARGVHQAGLVVLDTSTAQVLAMVGSRAWDGDDGQLNITTRRRNPGSALKPFVYAAALEHGDSPFSIAYDIRDASPNYVVPSAGATHGPVRYREALAGSYNFAAIDVLERTGIGTVMTLLKRAGVAALAGTPRDYGLRLALGSAKVRLIDLAAGYGIFMRGGIARDASGILAIDQRPTPAPELRRVISATTAWLIADILADRAARGQVFGRENPFDLPFDVAAKTGTMRGFADTVAIAATEQVLIGAWAGNYDGQPSQGALAMEVAAPLVRDALLAIARHRPLTLPKRPSELAPVHVCAISGMAPGPTCPTIRDWAQRGHEPTEPCDWHDPSTGRLRYPPRAAGWATSQAQEAPGTRAQ